MRHLALCFTLAGILFLIGCGSSNSSSKDDEGDTVASCTEPDNPYAEGTGHYAGYEWAENHGGGNCNSSSPSFEEGCEEYENQESEYQDCQAKKKR